METLTYPIYLEGYVSHWDEWTIVRELVQNAWDEDSGWKLYVNAGTLVVEDHGHGMQTRNLIMGISDKAESDRGQFGEGLKLAMVVAARMGFKVEVYSGDLYLSSGKGQLFGEDVLQVQHGESPEHFDGARVLVHGWEDRPTYQERFLRAGDPRIIYTDGWSRAILSQELPDFFIKGIWLSRARGAGRGYGFGYNLVDTKVNRDRGVVDQWEANVEIGKIWASVTDETLLEEFFRAIKDGQAEKSVNIAYTRPAAPKAMRRGFQAVFGTHAVVQTDEANKREAEYLGAAVIQVEYGLNKVLQEVVGTDKSYITEMQGRSQVHVPDKKLPDTSLAVLRGLRRLARKVMNVGVRAYVFEGDTRGKAAKDEIRISHNILSDRQQALATMIHELAHEKYGTDDATASMVDAVAKVAAELLEGYVWRN